jgi:hypothetical protein
MSVAKMKPKITANPGVVVDTRNIPARKPAPAIPSTRAIGSLSVRMTTASTALIAAVTVISERTAERKETAGESRPMRKM